MIEFTWTGTVAESHLWVRELSRFAEVAPTIGELASVRAPLEPHRLPYGVFPAGATDLDLLDEVLRARAPEAAVAEVLLEPRDEVVRLCARLDLSEAGRVVDWDRDQPIVALPGHVIRADRLLATVGLTADVIDTRQQEWDALREGWLTRLADAGWQPCSTAFLTAAMTGFLDVYERQSAPRMHDVVLVEPISVHPVVRQAVEALRRAGR